MTERVIGLLREAEILIEIGADTTTPSGHTRHSAIGAPAPQVRPMASLRDFCRRDLYQLIAKCSSEVACDLGNSKSFWWYH
jgi:hypothetical protein